MLQNNGFVTNLGRKDMEEVLIVQNISKKFKLSRKQMKISGESNPIKVVCKLREPITETIDLNVEYKEGNKKPRICYSRVQFF